jgi:hypothetical protein
MYSKLSVIKFRTRNIGNSFNCCCIHIHLNNRRINVIDIVESTSFHFSPNLCLKKWTARKWKDSDNNFLGNKMFETRYSNTYFLKTYFEKVLCYSYNAAIMIVVISYHFNFLIKIFSSAEANRRGSQSSQG